MAQDSPLRKRGVPDPGLEAIRDVVRGEIQGAVTGVTDRVAALERGLQAHNDRTFQAVETLSTAQAQQSCRIEELAGDTRDIAHRPILFWKARSRTYSPRGVPRQQPTRGGSPHLSWEDGRQTRWPVQSFRRPTRWPATFNFS